MMNSRQKEVLEWSLNDEEKVLKKLFRTYKQSETEINKKIKALKKDIENLDELASLPISEEEKEILLSRRQSKIYQKQYQESLKKQLNGIVDNMQKAEYKTISDYLTGCYENGFIGAMYDLQGQGIPMCFPLDQQAMVRAVQLDSKISKGLYTHLNENYTALKRKITAEVSRGIATGMSFQKIAKQLSLKMTGTYTNPKGAYAYAVRIARTEGHRVQVQSAMDACNKAKEKGADVLKQWDSALDKRTRESHAIVDGEIRELDKPFSNGLMFPGEPSGPAAEVINCRCALLQRARWALDNDELDTLKKRAEYFGLDKTENFEDYKKKYMKAAENVNNPLTNDNTESDIINNKYGFKAIKGEHTREFDLEATNPNYNKGREYRVNCQRCVSAYEARRRGFDVEALPALGGTDRMPYMADKVNGWTSVYKNIKPIECFSNRTAIVKQKVENTMQSFGDGARAIVRVQWQQKYGGGGHVFIAEQVEGKTIFIDPQPNKTDVSNYFSMAKTRATYVLRVDNLEFTDNILKCCKNKGSD